MDYGFFYLPPIDDAYGKPFLVAGDIMAMFNDRPEVRALMDLLAEFIAKDSPVIKVINDVGAVFDASLLSVFFRHVLNAGAMGPATMGSAVEGSASAGSMPTA